MAIVNKNARLLVLALNFAAAVTAAGIGLNTIIKSNRDQDFLKEQAKPTVANIDVSKINNVGIVMTVVNLVIAIITVVSLALTALPSFGALADKTLPLQVASLGFFLLFEIASLIPFMVFFVNDHANVTATLQGQPVPEALIKAVQKKLGISGEFKDLSYLRLLAIFPWISVAATILAVAVLYKAWSAVKAAPRRAVTASSSSDLKRSLEQTEKVEA